jgi:hypothetical protein
MRKIRPAQIAVFLTLFFIALALAVATTAGLLGRLPLGDFRGVTLVAAAIGFVYVYGIAIYRLFLKAFPLLPGEIEPDSPQEFIYHVYLLFYLLLFYPVLRSGIVPVPIMRAVYLGLGAKLGPNTFSSGIIMDPPFVEIGSNSLVGQYALVVPHAIENDRLSHSPVRIGNNVTIGAHAVVMGGVEIGDDALIAVGAVIRKGARIGAGEVWGGIPARKLDSPATKANERHSHIGGRSSEEDAR